MLRLVITWLATFVVLILVTSLFGMLGTAELVLIALLSLGVAIAVRRMRGRSGRARAAEFAALRLSGSRPRYVAGTDQLHALLTKEVRGQLRH